MGPGMSAYFKGMKFMIVMFVWFTILSLPAYFFYCTGNLAGLQENKNSIKYIFSALSLGNIGECKYCYYSKLL